MLVRYAMIYAKAFNYVVIPTPKDNLFLVLHIQDVIASADYLNDYPFLGLIYTATSWMCSTM